MRQELRWKLVCLVVGIILLVCIGLINERKAEQNKVTSALDETTENTEKTKKDTIENQESVAIAEYSGRIRVLLKTNDYEETVHEQLEICCGEEVFHFYQESGICYLNGEAKDLEMFPVYLEECEEGYVITSLERACGKPKVEGRLEIYREKGGFVVVNDLQMEDYLKHVVPSEMPASYEPEALKAQAICARTYAYHHCQSYAYPEYLAHIDDSANYQVYQNQEAHPSTTQAVKDTEGLILSYKGQPIRAYYFSTSWGHTSNEDIWWEGDADLTLYIKGKLVSEDGEVLDLSAEDAFLSFLHEENADGYDSSGSWYRWTTYIDKETLSEHLNEQLLLRYEANPEAILTLKEDGFVSVPIKSIGLIEKIEVKERGCGGVLQKIEVTGSEGTIQIMTEYNIRALLHVQGETIRRQDGSEVEGGSLLPSGYFAIHPEYKDQALVGFSFEGGGFGHGVGMSQNGANQMAYEGKNADEILKFFYQDVEIVPI